MASLIDYDVYFPLKGHVSRLMPVTVTNYRENAKEYDRARCANKSKNQEVNQILECSRERESPTSAALSVYVTFDKNKRATFNSSSYTLALALADKCARFTPFPGKLVATGRLLAENRIGKIGHFQEKLQTIAQALAAKELHQGDVLIYPAENEQQASGEERQLLKQLRQQGLQLRAANNLEALSDLWSQRRQPEKRSTQHFALLSVVLLLATASVFFWPASAVKNTPPVVMPVITKASDCTSLPLDVARLQRCIEPDLLNPADFQVDYSYRQVKENYAQVYPLLDKAVLHVHDRFKIHLTSPQDAYVYLYLYDSHGELHDLMTLSKKSHAISRDQSITLPSAKTNFTLDDQTGTETLYFLASRVPETALQAQYQALKTARDQGRHEQVKQLQQPLLAYLQKHQQRYFLHQ
ncbi:DUF4384 domain-containing protein [Candidatus Venteria ishoeyi]|uniref:DUF4384 domain-containing protein n=1 Tax=Candidatus Venteria ishoeyi TaxID=1899563 RepID=UPI0025A4F2D5|nr:DUF4384 domain-containing protein [Candidatus Venteria ishoeyi]MDM8545979.1 DUF4384 domain-containing protein [Candidatus Venteria ishoeyi]